MPIGKLMEFLRRERMRFQQPKIETHGRQIRIRAYVTERQPDGTFRRVRKVIPLGAVGDKPGEIKRRAAQVVAQLNSGSLIVERQIRMSEMLAGYREAGLPTVAVSTQAKYRAHLAKIEAAFGSPFKAAAQKEGMSLAGWLRAVAIRESKFDRNERRLKAIEARLTLLEGRAA